MLDTNVLSELIRASPSPVVLAWARAQDADAIFTTAVCEAEMLFGVAAMAEGRRQMALARAVDAILGTILGGRVLPFDENAGLIWARLMAGGKAQGRPRSALDTIIAAVAEAHGCTLVTDNEKDFADIQVINPLRGAVR